MGGICGRIARALPGLGSGGKWRALVASAALLGRLQACKHRPQRRRTSSSDVYAGDYQALALPAGTFLVHRLLRHAACWRYIQNPNNLLGKALLVALGRAPAPKVIPGSITLFTDMTRLVYFTSLWDHPLVLQAALDGAYVADANANIAGDSLALPTKSGVGDTILWATYGLVSDPANERFLGITNYVYLPTGVYDKNALFNTFTPGQVTDVPEIGLSEGLSKYGLRNFWLDVVANASIHSDGSAPIALFGEQYDHVRQDTSYDVKAFLRYQFAQSFWVAAGVEKSWGGNLTAFGGDHLRECPIWPWSDIVARYGRLS